MLKYGPHWGSPRTESGFKFTPMSMAMRPMGVNQRRPAPTASRSTRWWRMLVGVRQRFPAS